MASPAGPGLAHPSPGSHEVALERRSVQCRELGPLVSWGGRVEESHLLKVCCPLHHAQTQGLGQGILLMTGVPRGGVPCCCLLKLS